MVYLDYHAILFQRPEAKVAYRAHSFHLQLRWLLPAALDKPNARYKYSSNNAASSH